MKLHNVKRELSNPIFCIKKHYCPRCNEMLQKTKTEIIVNSNSLEAKNYNFSNGDTYLFGDVEFVKTVFKCNNCDKNYTIEELKANNSCIKRKK